MFTRLQRKKKNEKYKLMFTPYENINKMKI